MGCCSSNTKSLSNYNPQCYGNNQNNRNPEININKKQDSIRTYPKGKSMLLKRNQQ